MVATQKDKMGNHVTVAEAAPVSAPPAGQGFWQIPPMTKPEMPYIYAALNAAMQEIRAVGKEGYNEQQRYNFRGIDGVMSAAGPAFRHHGIVPRPRLITADYRDTKTTKGNDTREVTVRVEYEFFALDGSSVTVEVPGESLDQSDKGTAKAMSVAYRIALLQLLCIPTDEPDPDASYLSRDGKGEIPATVAKYILGKVATGPLSQLPELWDLILEHSAADRTAYTNDEGSYTWHETFGQRWQREVAGIDTFEHGKKVYDAAVATKAVDWRVGNTTVGKLLQARSGEMRAAADAAISQVVNALAEAENVDQVAAVESMLIEYAAKKIVASVNATELAQRIADKQAALAGAAAVAGEAVTP